MPRDMHNDEQPRAPRRSSTNRRNSSSNPSDTTMTEQPSRSRTKSPRRPSSRMSMTGPTVLEQQEQAFDDAMGMLLAPPPKLDSETFQVTEPGIPKRTNVGSNGPSDSPTQPRMSYRKSPSTVQDNSTTTTQQVATTREHRRASLSVSAHEPRRRPSNGTMPVRGGHRRASMGMVGSNTNHSSSPSHAPRRSSALDVPPGMAKTMGGSHHSQGLLHIPESSTQV